MRSQFEQITFLQINCLSGTTLIKNIQFIKDVKMCSIQTLMMYSSSAGVVRCSSEMCRYKLILLRDTSVVNDMFKNTTAAC